MLHGTQTKDGYDVVFIPFDRNGKPGEQTVFADGFAAFDPASATPGPARYRPIGIAEGPDGALYVADAGEAKDKRLPQTPHRRQVNAARCRACQIVHIDPRRDMEGLERIAKPACARMQRGVNGGRQRATVRRSRLEEIEVRQQRSSHDLVG